MQNIKPSQEKRFLKYYNKDAINSTVKDMKIIDYMKENDKEYVMIKDNYEYLKMFIDLAKSYNAKVYVIGFPSQNSWNYQRDKKFNELGNELGFEFINLY